MKNQSLTRERPEDGGALELPELGRAAAYAAASRADNTRRAYAADLRTFARWCSERRVSSLPAEPSTVAAYLAALADAPRAVSTIARALSAISQAHKLAGLESPREHRAVRETLAGIKRRLGTAQTGKAPLLIAALRAALPNAGASPLTAARDRAVLLLGFAGAFRRSELVSLNVEHLQRTAKGLIVHLERSKTDQEAMGQEIGIPHGELEDTCPVRAVERWLELSGLRKGPLFRRVTRAGTLGKHRLCDRSVALIVKAAAARAGLPTTEFAGHSLRAGLPTEAANAGKEERDIMRQTRHKSIAQVRKYIRNAEVFEANAAKGIGL